MVPCISNAASVYHLFLFKSNVLAIMNTRVNSLIDVREIWVIQNKLFILAYEISLQFY